MTDLTELSDGFYYIKLDDGEIRTDCYEGGYGFNKTSHNDIEKILSPVPLYKEYLESETHCAVYTEENKRLRELLKDVRMLWKGTVFMPDTQEQVRDVLSRIDAVIGESEEK